jgi:hypothetical protein
MTQSKAMNVTKRLQFCCVFVNFFNCEYYILLTGFSRDIGTNITAIRVGAIEEFPPINKGIDL